MVDKKEKLLGQSEAFFYFKRLNHQNLKNCLTVEQNSNKEQSLRTKDDLEIFLDKYSCFGCFLNNELVGFIILSIVDIESEIIDIVVSEDFTNKGAGSFLLENTINMLKEENVEKLFLEVAENNSPAIHMYNKFDFSKIGVRKDYYFIEDTENVDALVYKMKL